MDALLLCISVVLLVMAAILLSNVLFFPRLSLKTPAAPVRLSVLIPARNEAAILGATLAALTAQAAPNIEILVLDDNSTDATAALARAAGVRVLTGAPLPDGWAGKNWACHQLAEHASGDLLLFTDADVQWHPGALAALVAEFQRTDADVLTVWPTQTTITVAERLTVPLIALVVMAYLPVLAVHNLPLALVGAANGQCMVWRRAAYLRVGGHAVVRAAVLEDVTLARRVKRHGLRLRMADGGGLIGCRMYTDWPSVRRGFAKNILAGYGGTLPLLLATAFHWLIFLLPLLLFFTPARSPLLVALIVLAFLLRAISAGMTGQRVYDALALPVSVVLMTIIAGQALYWHVRYGGPQWKGRTIASVRHPHG